MRTYKTEDGKFITTDKAKFFINREVEKTPAYGKMTLFVCGIQDLKRTKEIANNNDIRPNDIPVVINEEEQDLTRTSYYQKKQPT